MGNQPRADFRMHTLALPKPVLSTITARVAHGTIVFGAFDQNKKRIAKTGRKNWAKVLPLALWVSNNIRGPISVCSPHQMVCGCMVVGFGYCPPIFSHSEAWDAV